ncbi:23S rRNA (adenine(2030)-N(6))-methyltransferase RlmJ [Psychrobium sp. 1_MG-2023]|uniref:23S rRNA (adenine(2030)-N(6))-methyltransferase RlmJ n=1 Tax=Psychrobium sp. 1_MG-2023 TaxID=3062624 RepID=UPI000C324996|nr:23S rRNA (adenine(2030)-N(6))-methyltransferase RlmJ [Psychrobium sp. 1_MG-2023]MDP2561094.1 23S rRNA (adenine(2030)-N(6))-methyltransferase RlmJ [Psychrobium sp. 1_MG-2023]PKF58382.1 23S rRNA (adenine(2030)-N(6))-methyltransferase RlmJ [Alteromonadales bacterium alter-6D02]
MLSYRHSFHAGNFADVLKHLVQTLIIDSLKQKPKPFVYHDTHSAAGRYDLRDEKSEKTGEYKDGIAKIWQQDDIPDVLHDYIEVIKELNPNGELTYYPGSPLVAKMLMGNHNRLELTELHPTDIELLKQEFQGDRKVRIQQIDGYKGIKAMLPPPQRRALVLIDPPYELKTEHNDAIKGIVEAHKRFSTGIYALWYPVVSRNQVNRFCEKFSQQGIRKILRIELCVKQDTNEFGMTGTGMIIVNPPWKLEQQMKEVLPWLTKHLAQDDSAHFKVEWLVEE